jgi:hypothetical protein
LLVAPVAAAFRFGAGLFGFGAVARALALAFTAFLAVFFAALALGAARFRLAVFLAVARPRPAAFRAPAFLPAFDELRREARAAFRLAMDVLSVT